MTKNKFYAVVRGAKPGIYNSWYGKGGAEAQVKGFPDSLHKGFRTRTEAEQWLKEIDHLHQEPEEEIDD